MNARMCIKSIEYILISLSLCSSLVLGEWSWQYIKEIRLEAKMSNQQKHAN